MIPEELLADFADYPLHRWNIFRDYLSYKAHPQQERHKNEVNTMGKIMVLGKAKSQTTFLVSFSFKACFKSWMYEVLEGHKT